MSLIMTQSSLAANLACFGECNADVAEAIRGAEPPPDLRFTESGAGILTADLAGRALASRKDPLQEAEKLADTLDLVENAAIVVLGFHPDDASGYGRLVLDDAGALEAIVEDREATPEQRANVLRFMLDVVESFPET